MFIAEINNLDNVGMVELSEKFCLFLEPAFNILIMDETGLELFGGNPPAHGQLIRLIDISHSALIGDQTDDLKAMDLRDTLNGFFIIRHTLFPKT
jgi:hypothetical protein